MNFVCTFFVRCEHFPEMTDFKWIPTIQKKKQIKRNQNSRGYAHNNEITSAYKCKSVGAWKVEQAQSAWQQRPTIDVINKLTMCTSFWVEFASCFEAIKKKEERNKCDE